MIKKKTPLPESRICNECGQEYKPTERRLICRPCINRIARDKFREKTQQLIDEGLHVPYRGVRPEGMPEDFEERRREYVKIQKLTKHMGRDEYREFLHNRLNEIMNNKPLWVYLTRPGLGETPKKEKIEEGKGKGRGKGRPKKEMGIDIAKDDTRNLNWDDYEQWGFNLPEDE